MTGADDRVRCPWPGVSDPGYAAYHDTEWGVPLRGEREMFERLSLEAFQSGLSWLTILRKREHFRRAFDDFVVDRVADYTPGDVDRLLSDPGIVRNRAKIEATIRNARAVAGLDGPLDEVLWSFAPDPGPVPGGLDDVPAMTPESTAMAGTLKRHGFSFVGPTTCYALMQATGMVNDHIATCWRRS